MDTSPQNLVLDKLDQTIRHLWFELGRERDQQRIAHFQKQIREKVQVLKSLRPYERHCELWSREAEMRVLLADAETILTAKQKEAAEVKKEIEGAERIKGQYQQLMERIRQGEETIKKIENLGMEIQAVVQINLKVQDKQPGQILDFCNQIRENMVADNASLQATLHAQTQAVEQLKSSLNAEQSQWQAKCLQRRQLQQTLHQQIQNQLHHSLARSGPSRPPLGHSPPVHSTTTHRMTRNNVITSRRRTPAWQWYWLMVLVLWALGLLVLPTPEKQQVGVEVGQTGQVCY